VLRKIQRVHFVGIGGSGMSGIAEVLLNLGYQVSGSDQKRSAVTERLAALGARIYEGHAAANIAEAQVVVTSTAVKADNPEVVQARRQGVPVIPRAEMLAELMRLKYGVAVAGSHGKTTTTSMVAMILDKGGLDPTVVVGGRVGTLGSGAKLGKGEFMVAEADESDRSFLKLTPTVAVVTNIDREHLDTYKDLADVQEAFLNFVNKVPFYGAAVLCLDDPAVQDILPRVERRIVTYGVSRQAEVSARDVVLGPMGSTYTACSGNAVLGSIELPVPGHHNVLNSLAAVAVGLDLGVPFAAVKEGLASFTGVDRRFQLRGEAGGITVIDDYGHHPTEIRATLETLRGRAGTRRTVVLFQPHRYTRTMHLWDDFCRAFHLADLVVLVDIYPAGEEPIQGISSETLADAIGRKGHRHVVYGGDMRAAVEHLLGEVREGDVVLTLGAGSVWTMGDELLRRRAEASRAGGGKA
jgi:UDP-N-acetylmuramate--alanine ligase